MFQTGSFSDLIRQIGPGYVLKNGFRFD